MQKSSICICWLEWPILPIASPTRWGSNWNLQKRRFDNDWSAKCYQNASPTYPRNPSSELYISGDGHRSVREAAPDWRNCLSFSRAQKSGQTLSVGLSTAFGLFGLWLHGIFNSRNRVVRAKRWNWSVCGSIIAAGAVHWVSKLLLPKHRREAGCPQELRPR